MADVIEPTGPLPTEVYWRRRILAVAVGVVALALVIGLIIWAGSGGDKNTNDAAKNAAVTSAAPSEAPAPPPGAEESPAAGAPTPAEDAGHAPAPSSQPPAPAEPGGQTPAQTPPAEGAAAAQCSDQSLSVVLYTDKPTYTKGDQPVFTIVTTNGGLAACSRDVGKAAMNVVVRSLDGTRTLWAAQDCAPDHTVNNQVLAPGQQVRETITWSGATSNPGCDKPRVAIPVGAYQAIAKVGARESAPITFNVIAPPQQ